MAEAEDVPYSTPDFATPDKPTDSDDPDRANKSVLKEMLKYLDDQIAKHNSLDLVEPNAEPVMTTQQQVTVQKQVVSHLRNIRNEISNKLKELK